MDVDCAVIGAGLAGTAFAASLRLRGYSGTLLLLEAGRGPGGRAATRRTRDDLIWRLDHGSPCLSFSQKPQRDLDLLLKSLLERGAVVPDLGTVVGVNEFGCVVSAVDHPLLRGPRFRGLPTMASVCQSLLQSAGSKTRALFRTRISQLRRQDGWWWLSSQHRARRLVITGNLLAHPRSLAIVGSDDVPLRSAVPVGFDQDLDAALERIRLSAAAVRFNLMLELPGCDDFLPRQIWLTSTAQKKFGIERIVSQRQEDGRIGLVVHGLADGAPISPATTSKLLLEQENHQHEVLPVLLQSWPELTKGLSQARCHGVMRWGASQPLDHPLPQSLQWCSKSSVGFCGDWIDGPGFGMAEGALQSAIDLAGLLV